MRDDGCKAQTRAEALTGLVTSLTIVHDNCPSKVSWPTPHHDFFDHERRPLVTGRDSNGGGPGCDHREGRDGSGRKGSSWRPSGQASSDGGNTEIAAPTATPEAEEEAPEVVATLNVVETPAREPRQG